MKKTEVTLLGNKNISNHLQSPSLHIDDISLEAKVKKLGVTIDNNFSMSFLSAPSVKTLMFNLKKLPAWEIV